MNKKKSKTEEKRSKKTPQKTDAEFSLVCLNGLAHRNWSFIFVYGDHVHGSHLVKFTRKHVLLFV